MSSWTGIALEFIQHARRDVGRDIGRGEALGSVAQAAATAALAEQVGRLADVAEAWQKAQAPQIMRSPLDGPVPTDPDELERYEEALADRMSDDADYWRNR